MAYSVSSLTSEPAVGALVDINAGVGASSAEGPAGLVQSVRYIFVGGAAFIVDAGLLVLLVEALGVHVLLAAALGFCAGTVVNYALSTRWVFHHRTVKDPRIEFLVFAALGVCGLGLNEVLMWLLVAGLSVHYAIAKFVVAACVLCWNFFARKLVLFRG